MESGHASSARKQLCILLSWPRWFIHDYSQSFSFCVRPQSRSSTKEAQSMPTHLSWPGFPLFGGSFPPRPPGCDLRRPKCPQFCYYKAFPATGQEGTHHPVHTAASSDSAIIWHYSSPGQVPLESWQEASRDTQSDPEVFLIVEGQLRLSPVELPHSPHMMGVMHLLFCKYCAVGDGGVRMKKHSEKPLWKTQWDAITKHWFLRVLLDRWLWK